MPYTQTTLDQATAALASRLADPTMVRWVLPELRGLIVEAIRTWNALTGHFRDQGVFNTTTGQTFYDLATALPTLRGYTVTDADLVVAIEYALLEPASASIWDGSDMFTLADVVAAIQRRRDQFLLETGIVLTHTTSVVTPTTNGRQPLDQTVMTVRRVALQNVDGVTPLHREDVWGFTQFAQRWPQQPGRPPATPFGYSVGETPPLVLQIVPPLSDRCVMDLVTVSKGPALDPVTRVPLGIPDDWTWVVKYGALADLLSTDGLPLDLGRVAYCEARWQQGVQLARTSSIVWAARINNVPVEMAALTEADQYAIRWQSVQGMPRSILTTDSTLLALSPPPNTPAVTPSYSVTLDLVRNAPVPITGTDFLQLGEEVLDVIYDYAEHVALTKEGAPSLDATKGLLDRFMRAAGVTVAIDTASTPNLDLLTSQSSRDETQTARTAGAS